MFTHLVQENPISSNGTSRYGPCEELELITTGSSTITRTLPVASGAQGSTNTYKKIDGASGLVVITGGGSPADTIDGQTTYTLTNRYQFVRLHCDGTTWHVIGNN